MESLNGSELGTQEYWDKSYAREIKNYKSHGDVGEIWFDENSQQRVIDWIVKCEEITLDQPIVDVGCGNGMMLIELGREGYRNLTGIDYSLNGIELAINIARDQDIYICYQHLDILSPDFLSIGPFMVVHDKGTYDAISLHPEDSLGKCQQYTENVHKILDDNGFFIITSCNWTEEELIARYEGKFSKFAVIPTPLFRFGGKVGSVVTSLVFKKC